MAARAMVLCALTAWTAVTPVAARTTTKKQGGLWMMENEQLRVTVNPMLGSMTVRDKSSGYVWRQPETERAQVTLRRVSTPPAIDGDLTDWRDKPTVRLMFQMTTYGKVDSDADCSAEVWCSWDTTNLYVAARVRDDVLKFGPSPSTSWWEREAVELWVGGGQVGINLNPTASNAMATTGFAKEGPLPDARIKLRLETGGYAVEAGLSWASLPQAPQPAPGARFPFAVGVDDADGTGSPDGQLYFPSTWVHSNLATLAEATLADERGNVPATSAKPGPRFRRARELTSSEQGLAFEADFGKTKGKPNTVTVSLTADASDLVIGADMPDRNTEVTSFDFLQPLLLDTPKGVLAVADYGNGHLYPLDLKPFPRSFFRAGGLDMPWVGVCDLDRGFGYLLILESSDDALVRCGQYPVGGRQAALPQVVWNPSRGKFAYPRRVIYRFVATGGYVALAKAYRAYAREKGLIVPLTEKLRRNPNISRLFGAADVWGNASLAFAQQAKAAGVDKMLLHGRTSPEETKAINALGYLTSDCDNYVDILPLEAGKDVDSGHDRLPDNAVLRSDGQPLTAWLAWDKKTRYAKRCPALWVSTAQAVIPKTLREFPFLGRLLDGITAEGLYECYNEKHPLTKAQKRQCGLGLLQYVRTQNLVVGGEQGVWWAAPYVDYVEGTMTGGYCSWPVGHLIRPNTKVDQFSSPWGGRLGAWAGYERWGIGHEWRVPLWELVFHDCVVSTWNRGDANDWLLQVAPEVTAKKDAFNILYGTIPLLWANKEGSWRTAREVFLRSCRNTSKLHEAIAGTEMLGHEFVTPDHAVQRTRFSDGTVVVVNFGEKPYSAEVGGRTYLLPQNGFAVKGPRIEQSLALVDGKPVTSIKGQG